MEYQILRGTDSSELQSKVNDWIEKGWYPHGSLVVIAIHVDDEVIHDEPYNFYQPMIKREV